MILCSSRRGAWGIDLRGYLGARLRVRVLGRWKVVEYLALTFLWEWIYGDVRISGTQRSREREKLTPLRAAWAAFLACDPLDPVGEKEVASV